MTRLTDELAVEACEGLLELHALLPGEWAGTIDLCSSGRAVAQLVHRGLAERLAPNTVEVVYRLTPAGRSRAAAEARRRGLTPTQVASYRPTVIA